jgi:hypothetical protein
MMIVSIVERSEFQVGITEGEIDLVLVSRKAALHIAGQLKVLSESLMQIVEQQTLFIRIGLGDGQRVDLSPLTIICPLLSLVVAVTEDDSRKDSILTVDSIRQSIV